MKSALQKELQHELNERVPRGPRGSRQNEFRFGVWFWRSQGYSFDDSLAKAMEAVRRHEPAFTPRTLSPRASAVPAREA
jgi:hypothetical protein